MRQALRGEHRAWEVIVDRHLPVVNAIARSYRLSVPDREDAVQTVWLTLNQHLPRLHSPEGLRTWLRRVTHDTCSRQRRNSARQRPVDPHGLALLPLPGDASPEAEYLLRERNEELHRAVGLLTDPGERRAARRYFEEPPGPAADPPTGPATGPSAGPETSPSAGRTNPRAAANQRRRMLRRLRRFLEEST